MYHHTKSLAKATQVEEISSAEVSIDEQTIAQAELDAYIEQLAQAIAPELEIQFIDHYGFYNARELALGKTIATITYNSGDLIAQPWVVMVGDVEVHRADTWAECAHYIQWHYKQGTLPKLKTISPEELLDKPFDELTSLEWKVLKAYKPQPESLGC